MVHNFKSFEKDNINTTELEFMNKLINLYEKALGRKVNKDELFKKFKSNTGIDGNVYYGLTNLNEFLAESLTNPEFQYYLSTIKTETNKSIYQEIYESLVSFIKSILNKDVQDGSNLLKDTIDTVMDFMENNNSFKNNDVDLTWDSWKLNILKADSTMNFEIWQTLTNKEKIQILNCL